MILWYSTISIMYNKECVFCSKIDLEKFPWTKGEFLILEYE